MGFLASILTLRDSLGWALFGLSPLQQSIANSEDGANRFRPFGPELTPHNLPSDLPIHSLRGYRKRPLAQVTSQGDVSLVYQPRDSFDAVASFYEEQLPVKRWTVTDSKEDVGVGYRARRFEVQKGARLGSVAVEETVTDLGPIEHRVVTVSIDILCWD
jgi:hypothetical protein